MMGKNLARTPPNAAKRRLEGDFETAEGAGESAKKPFMGDIESRQEASLFGKIWLKINLPFKLKKIKILKERRLFETEYKASLTKIASLEQELKNAQNEKKNFETDLESIKRKHEEEKRVNLFNSKISTIRLI